MVRNPNSNHVVDFTIMFFVIFEWGRGLYSYKLHTVTPKWSTDNDGFIFWKFDNFISIKVKESLQVFGMLKCRSVSLVKSYEFSKEVGNHYH